MVKPHGRGMSFVTQAALLWWQSADKRAVWRFGSCVSSVDVTQAQSLACWSVSTVAVLCGVPCAEMTRKALCRLAEKKSFCAEVLCETTRPDKERPTCLWAWTRGLSASFWTSFILRTVLSIKSPPSCVALAWSSGFLFYNGSFWRMFLFIYFILLFFLLVLKGSPL